MNNLHCLRNTDNKQQHAGYSGYILRERVRKIERLIEVVLNVQKKRVRKRFESEKTVKRDMWLKSEVVLALEKKRYIAPLGHFPSYY